MNALRLPFNFDVSRMIDDIHQFDKEDYYDIYNPSVNLKTLWAKHLIEPTGKPGTPPLFLPNDSLKKCPYLLSILETFKCKKETFRIHRLEGGSKIRPHRDIGYSYEQGFIRIHIPVETSEEVHLEVNGERIKMEAGECWYCNFHETHEVKNESNKPRIHLIMDCIVNDWVKEIFEKAMKLND